MNIAIWGLGVSGRSALEYLKDKHQVFAINAGDKHQWFEPIKDHIALDKCYGENEVDDLVGKLDLIILSPGVSPKNPALLKFKDVPRYCEVELAYQNIQDAPPIVAITGTNGKTSTVTLLGEALKLAGKKVFVGGNIGTPFCEYFKAEKPDVIVLELSSFQLELLETFHPQVSCILNISPSHMERYESFEDYENAKLHIKDNQVPEDLYLAPEQYSSTHCYYHPVEPLQGFDWTASKLRGDHYKENFMVVHSILNFLELDAQSIVQKLINEFTGVPLRLEYRGNFSGIEIYNDGKSTNTAATLSAVESFQNDEVTLALGGQKRDAFQDWSLLKNCSQIKTVLAFGEAAQEIADQLEDTFEVICFDKLNEEIKEKITGNVFLFSPGYPSFDQFENYLKRGDYLNSLFS